MYDDNADVTFVLERMLAKLGAKSYIAYDSENLIKLIDNFKSNNIVPNVFILDLILPGDLGGDELIYQIKDNFSNSYCIVSSGFSDNVITEKFSNYGFDDVLRKPYTMNDLQKVLFTNYQNYVIKNQVE